MNRGDPLVSVIVPTRNRPAGLAEALVSIAAQRGVETGEVEVIVVNDGGTPAGIAAAEARERGLRIRVINHLGRMGVSRARDTGLGQARGRHVAFLDDDAVFLPRHLATALAGLESGADGVITTCLVGGHRAGTSGPGPVTGAVPWDAGFDPLLLEACNLLPVPAAVFRRPGAARMDPALPAIGDWDFWLRMVRGHGYRFTRLDEPTVVGCQAPWPGSRISGDASGTAETAGLSAVARRTWERWPASTARTARFRLYTGIMYWQVLGLPAAGQAPDPYRYLRSVQAIERAWRSPDDEEEPAGQLALAVAGDAGIASAA